MKHVLRTSLLAALVLIAACAAPSSGPESRNGPKYTAPEKLDAICQRYWDIRLASAPRMATSIGVNHLDGKLEDIRPRKRKDLIEAYRALLGQLDSIDPATLDQGDTITHEVLRETLRIPIEVHDSGIDLDSWNLNPRGGPQTDFLKLVEFQPAETKEERDRMLARWRLMPSYLDQACVNLRRGLAQGRVTNQKAATAIVAQLDKLLQSMPEKSTLSLPGRAAGATPFGVQLLTVVRDEIFPAFARYRACIADEVLPSARSDDKPGVLHVPGGADYYRVAIREHTSLDLTPQEIHEIGLREVAKIRAEMSTLGSRVFGTNDVAAIQKKLREDPALHFATAAEVQAKAESALRKAEQAMAASFGILPKAPCEVVPIPAHEAPHTTVAYYQEPAADGSRPGRYYINTFAPTTRTRYEAEVLAYHEAIPGHHVQIAIAQELDLPEFRRHEGSTAFIEGWALYTERLSDEMGLYSGDLDRLGVLSYDAWRACRLVVDTGLHAFSWTRQQAIDYMFENTLLAENNIENEVDRYIAWPGQALAYKLGQLEIRRLREEARSALGDAFELADFHDRVLENGAVTLRVLRRYVEGWSRR